MIFEYLVTTKDNKVQKGVLEALNQETAILELKKKGYFVVKINKQKQLLKMELSFGGIKFIDKVLLARHLAIMMKAGVNLAEALDVITEQASHPKLRKVLKSVTAKVLSGNTLSQSLAEYPKIFSDLFINMVRIGETSGTLADNLEYLATEMEKSFELKKKIKGAAIYPIIILLMTFGLGFVLVYFILPKMMKLFESLTMDLPITTKMMIAIAHLMEKNGTMVLAVLVALIFLFIFLMKQKFFRHWMHHLVLYIPIVNKIVIQFNLANLYRTLGILFKSGVPVLEGLKITSGVLGNYVYNKELSKLAIEVEKGMSLSESFLNRNPKLFPKIATRLIGVGEKTGELDNSLNYLGEFYGREVDNITKNMATIIEPMLLVGIGLIVGFVAVSIIQPIYQISGGIKK